MNDNDISKILKEWKFNPDENLNVRLIDGDNGSVKIQMRIDMGLLQINIDGSPSGEDINGYESWLEYYDAKRIEFEKNHVDDFFTLSTEECRNLNSEAIRYYYRYFCLMRLEDFERVIRDTDRNLRSLEFVKKYAAREIDSWETDQYRPYIIMMNSRAKAAIALGTTDEFAVDQAIYICENGINKIQDFFNEYNISEESQNSLELQSLIELKEEFESIRPESLENKLKKAIEQERYEEAARFRDEIRKRKEKSM
jgi:hypothetical protein